MFSKGSTHMAVHIYNGIFGCWYLEIISYTIIRSVLIFLNLVSYYKDIYHDKATAFFCEYLLKCAFPCDLLGMWICYIYLWYTNARQTAKLLWCFLDSVLKGGVWNSNKNKWTSSLMLHYWIKWILTLAIELFLAI